MPVVAVTPAQLIVPLNATRQAAFAFGKKTSQAASVAAANRLWFMVMGLGLVRIAGNLRSAASL